MKLIIKISLLTLAFYFALTISVLAIGTSSSSWNSTEKENTTTVSLFEQGTAASKSGDYQKAQDLFTRALQADPENPDILNMLAHTQLKLEKIDEALDNYKKALKLRPRFPEAREYLGETYIQAALQQIEILKGYGPEGKEELEDLSGELQKAGQSVK